MADKYLSKVDFTYLWGRLKTLFAGKTEFETLSGRVDNIVSQGGEPNVIDTVKVNGTALTPDANKAVDVEVPLFTIDKNNGEVVGATIKDGYDNSKMFDWFTSQNRDTVTLRATDGNDDLEKMLATTNYVDANGGKIDKIKVNGTEQSITNKEVDLTVPTAVSALSNDSNYQTATDVESAISTAVASAYKYKGSVANYEALNAVSTKANGDVYDVQDTGMNYAWNGTAWDPLGQIVNTAVLWTSAIGQSNTLEAMTTEEIDEILNA